jgi:hypothetical protein
MATFSLTGQLLQLANKMGINPDLDIIPGYIGFQYDDVNKYGYLLLFVISSPLRKCDMEPQDVRLPCVASTKRTKKNYRAGTNDEDNKSYSVTGSDGPVDDGFEAKESKNNQNQHPTHFTEFRTT